MIRAIRPSAMAQDDASMVSGWNVSPNVAYTLFIAPSASACAVFIFDANMITLLASGAAPVGVDQPCVLVPNSGQLGMVDADLGWHLLMTTTGTESQRTIRIGPAVDLPDEIHPIYADDDLSVVRATAGVDDHAHYIDDVSVTCPLGLGAGLGAIASMPVDGVAVAGQVESITWTATPDGASDAAVIRRYVAIAPEPYVDPEPVVPPVAVDDAAETDAVTAASGNVLTNDTGSTLVVSAVNGLSAKVGATVAGSDGGEFVIESDGSWTFDPAGDFATLAGEDTAETSVAYHISNGVAESVGTLTVTVRAVAGALWGLDEITTALRLEIIDPLSITLNGSTASQIADRSGNSRHAAQATAGNQATYSGNVLTFDAAASPNYDYYDVPLAEYGALFMVVKKPNANDKGCLCRDSRTIDRDGIFITPSGVTQLQRGATVGAITAGPVATIGQWNILYAEANGTTRALRVNGGAATTVASTSKINLSQIGYYNYLPPMFCFEGEMAFIVGLPAAPSAELRQTIEGYLAHAVGAALGITRLVDALPSDHPYKSTAPTV